MTRLLLLALMAWSAIALSAQDYAFQTIQRILVSPMEKGDEKGWTVEGPKSAKLVIGDTSPEVSAGGAVLDPKTLKPVTVRNLSAFVVKAGALKGRDAISLVPGKALKIPGITKQISFWIRGGEGAVEKISLLIEDIHGIRFKLPMDYRAYAPGSPGEEMTFRQFNLYVPPFVEQADFNSGTPNGLLFRGLELVLGEGAKNVTVSIDMITAVTDLFYETGSGEGEMNNDW
jgi:hypothetical protein